MAQVISVDTQALCLLSKVAALTPSVEDSDYSVHTKPTDRYVVLCIDTT